MQLVERRKLPRVNISLQTSLRGIELTQMTAKTLDVSKGGALLDTPLPLREGDEVELHFDLDISQMKPITARVLRSASAFWGRRHTVAVQFHEENAALMDVVQLIKYQREGYRNRDRSA